MNFNNLVRMPLSRQMLLQIICMFVCLPILILPRTINPPRTYSDLSFTNMGLFQVPFFLFIASVVALQSVLGNVN